MDTQWIRDRALLRSLMSQYPYWSNPQYAQATGRSLSWVKQWKIRLKQAPRDDMQVLLSYSRAHHAPYHRWDLQVIQRLGEMRQQPPEHLQRVPGPKTLVYFLQRDPHLHELGVAVPRSSRSVWKLLRQHGSILPRVPRQHQPLEPREPLEEGQVDFKDATTVPADPSGEGKRHHLVEVCNFVDAGTSILLSAQAHDAFREETAEDRDPGVLTHLWTATHVHLRSRHAASSAVAADGIFPPRWCAFSSAWGLPPTSVRRLGPTKMPTSRDLTARTSRNAYLCIIPGRSLKCAA